MPINFSAVHSTSFFVFCLCIVFLFVAYVFFIVEHVTMLRVSQSDTKSLKTMIKIRSVFLTSSWFHQPAEAVVCKGLAYEAWTCLVV